MRRNMVLAQLAVFAGISLLIIGYTVFGLLKVNPFSSPFTVRVQLAQAGGLFEGSEVSFRGVKVGTVTGVDLHPDGVTATLSIDQGTRIPDNSMANVQDLSAVGEQYIDLRPPDHGADNSYLHDGSVIPASRTTTPLETATVLYDLEQFIDSVNPVDLQIIGREGALAFTGVGPQLRSILQNASDIVSQLATSQQATSSLLDNAALLLKGAADHTSDLDAFTASLNTISSTLAASTPTITSLIQQAGPTTRLVNSLITSTGSSFIPLMSGLAGLSAIQTVRIPGLKELLIAVPEFATLAPALINDGALQGAANFNQSQALCNTGVPLTSPISGIQSKTYAVQCGSGIVRGAANAPGATGTASASAAVASAVPVGDGTDGVQVGSYDPSTGLTSASDGQLVRLGSTGGQDAFLGSQSWKTILFNGLAQ